MPYILIALPHIYNLPFLCMTFMVFTNVPDQHLHHIHKIWNELCLWDLDANISQVPKGRVPLDIKCLAVKNLIDIMIRHGYRLGACEFSKFALISQF